MAGTNSVDETLQMAAHFGEDARLVAGGTWVTLVVRQGLLMPQALISLCRVPGLHHIEVDETGALRLGALVTHSQVERSPLVQAGWPVLAETFATVDNVRIRNQATVGGVLCDADCASDPPATLVALGAELALIGPTGERRLPVRDSLSGVAERGQRVDGHRQRALRGHRARRRPDHQRQPLRLQGLLVP